MAAASALASCRALPQPQLQVDVRKQRAGGPLHKLKMSFSFRSATKLSMSQSPRFVVQSATLCCQNRICHVFDERVTPLLSLNLPVRVSSRIIGQFGSLLFITSNYKHGLILNCFSGCLRHQNSPKCKRYFYVVAQNQSL